MHALPPRSIYLPGRRGDHRRLQCLCSGLRWDQLLHSLWRHSLRNIRPAGRQLGSECVACPAVFNGFSFFHQSTNSKFVPAAVARAGAKTSGDCLAEFAQVADAAWHMGGTVSLMPVSGIRSFADCTESCRTDAICQYITYDYEAEVGAGCFKKTAPLSVQRYGNCLQSGGLCLWMHHAVSYVLCLHHSASVPDIYILAWYLQRVFPFHDDSR